MGITCAWAFPRSLALRRVTGFRAALFALGLFLSIRVVVASFCPVCESRGMFDLVNGLGMYVNTFQESLSASTPHSRQESSRYMENYSESEDSEGGQWKSKSRRKRSSVEDDDLSQPWVCTETDPFTSRICHFDFPKTRMPSHVKTHNGSEDPEDHLKIFQAAAKMERWAMPTWCHMFNSTLTGNARVWFDDLPPESLDSYNESREAF
ncbi:hypothetical protein Tco_0491104 [Tanacetum coccineum]